MIGAFVRFGATVEYQYAGIATDLCAGARLFGFSFCKIKSAISHLPSPALQMMWFKMSTLSRGQYCTYVILVTLIPACDVVDIELFKVVPYVCKFVHIPPHHT